jgi:hypothetical protein
MNILRVRKALGALTFRLCLEYNSNGDERRGSPADLRVGHASARVGANPSVAYENRKVALTDGTRS